MGNINRRVPDIEMRQRYPRAIAFPRLCARRVQCWQAILCQQPLGPERGCAAIESLGHCTQLRKISVYEACIDIAFANWRRAAERHEQADIAAWTRHNCPLEC